MAYRVAPAQGFVEGNKRTALLLARWVLDHNGVDGSQILPSDDLVLADLLVQAAAGVEVEGDGRREFQKPGLNRPLRVWCRATWNQGESMYG